LNPQTRVSAYRQCRPGKLSRCERPDPLGCRAKVYTLSRLVGHVIVRFLVCCVPLGPHGESMYPQPGGIS
jgi:hypothetical protein